MNKGLMGILACPMCEGKLVLKVDEEDRQEIVTGSRYCPKCAEHYPIVDTIPNLFPPDQHD